jgi:MinD-like ATPase involved in chromosome partitioning or flagellar assembly
VSNIYFVGGEKGGVGKSVCARALAQWCVDRSHAFAAVDCDVNQQSLARSYGEFTQVLDLGHNESADQIVDRALGSERRVVVDLPAQSSRLLEAWLDGAKVLEFAQELGVGVTFLHVTDGGAASVRELERSLAHVGRRADHVVVKNQGRARDFVQFDESTAHQQLQELAGKLITVPELDATAMYKVDRFGLSFWAAAKTDEGDHALGALERRRVQLWLEQCYREFDRVLA